MYNTHIKHIVITVCTAFSISTHALAPVDYIRNAAPGSYGLGFIQGVWAEIALMAINDTCRNTIEKVNVHPNYPPMLDKQRHNMIWSITAALSGFLLSNVSYYIWKQYITPIWKYVIQGLHTKALLRGFSHGRGMSAITIIGSTYAINGHLTDCDVYQMCCYELGSLIHTTHIAQNL